MKRAAVIGLGSFGLGLARILTRLGARVTAVDRELRLVEMVKDEVHTAIRMDATDRDALAERGIHEVDCAVVTMGEKFEAAEICAFHLEELGCPRVLVRGTTRERVEILRALGPEVLTPGIDAARRLAVVLMSGGLTDFVPLPGEHDLALARVSSSRAGKTLADLGLDRQRVHVLAIRRGAAEIFAGPGPNQLLEEGEDLFLLGAERDLIRAGSLFA